MKFSRILLVMLGVFQAGLLTGAIMEKPLVVLITSYNNERWVEENLHSVFIQKYENYRVIYVDDCSGDKTYERVVQLVRENGQQHRFTIIRNDERRNAMANFYTSIHACADEEIVITLDGDDFFAHDQVLARVNEAYSNPDIWFTYGQFKYYPADQLSDINRPIPLFIVDNNWFRVWNGFPVSHLRTHYAWLFKLVKLEDFLYEDYYYPMASDKAMLAPMMEMAAQGHYLQLHEVLYIYNNSNPLCDGTINSGFQTSLRDHILHQPPYQPLDQQKSVEILGNQDRVSLVVLCNDKPNYMNIDNMLKRLGHVYETYILVPANSVVEKYDGMVNYVVYERDTLAQKLRECIEALDSRYVMLGTDLDDVVNDIDFIVCVKLLKKTHTSLFYCAMGYDPEDQHMLNRKKLPRVSFEYPVYAWHSNNKNLGWQVPAIHMTIWDKKLLSEALTGVKNGDLDELQGSLDMWLTHDKSLGFCLKVKKYDDQERPMRPAQEGDCLPNRPLDPQGHQRSGGKQFSNALCVHTRIFACTKTLDPNAPTFRWSFFRAIQDPDSGRSCRSQILSALQELQID